MRRLRSAKVIATVGPASSSPERIRALFDAGADVFRLNFSHGTHDDHRAVVAAIRDVEATCGRPIGILADLQGPKLRIGKVDGGKVRLEKGARFTLELADTPGDATRASLPHPEIFQALRPHTQILIDDGKLRLTVEQVVGTRAETVVAVGGELSSNKGVNVPGVVLPIAPLTAKDRADLDFALGAGVDWVALSFVQRPSDVIEARKLVNRRAALMAKIEKPSAVQSLDEIVELVDGIMVARGDLGVELPIETVPGLQKKIVRAARAAGKPVVVATQMLESMIGAPTPTRAEVSDVVTAVYDGADAVMLSAESAAGAYPVEAVTMMSRIAGQAEHDPLYRAILNAEWAEPEATAVDALSAAARQVAETLGAAAVVTFTSTGSTALRTARKRPQVPVLALTHNLRTARQLAVVWGVHSVHTDDAQGFEDMHGRASRIAQAEGFAKVGDNLIVTYGVPFGTPGATNTLYVATVD
jgi:pyruvate kinase